MKKSTYVQCFYCEGMFNRPQGRAAHIRKAHPGAPYQPTPEQIAQYKAKHSTTAAAPPADAPAPPPMPQDAIPLTPRDHLVAAIGDLKGQLESTRRQIPALEDQLQDLHTSQSRMEQDLQALDTALAAIDGTSQTQLELEPETPAQPSAGSESSAPQEPTVVRPSARHARPQRLAAGAARD